MSGDLSDAFFKLGWNREVRHPALLQALRRIHGPCRALKVWKDGGARLVVYTRYGRRTLTLREALSEPVPVVPVASPPKGQQLITQYLVKA